MTGCGIGRDTNWLNLHGFLAIGVDGSEEMLKQAAKLYPANMFIHDCLPELQKLATLQFQNILCSAVLMHLNQNDLIAACSRLLQLLSSDGCLVISFRETNEADYREKGKLYQPISIDDFLAIFTEMAAKLFCMSQKRKFQEIWFGIILLSKNINIPTIPIIPTSGIKL